MTSKIPPELHAEIIELAEKEYKKGFSTEFISVKAKEFLKNKEIDVSTRTIRRFLEQRDKKVAQAITTIVNTTYDIDLDKPKVMVDTIVSFLDDEIKKSISKPDLGTNTLHRQKEIIGWLDILDKYIDKLIKISTLTSSRKEDTQSQSLTQGQILVTEDELE